MTCADESGANLPPSALVFSGQRISLTVNIRVGDIKHDESQLKRNGTVTRLWNWLKDKALP